MVIKIYYEQHFVTMLFPLLMTHEFFRDTGARLIKLPWFDLSLVFQC